VSNSLEIGKPVSCAGRLGQPIVDRLSRRMTYFPWFSGPGGQTDENALVLAMQG
jgi:hypothetical protein